MSMEEARIDKSKYVKGLHIEKGSNKKRFETTFTIPGVKDDGSIVPQEYRVILTNSVRKHLVPIVRKDLPEDSIYIDSIASLIFSNKQSKFSVPVGVTVNSGEVFSTVVKSVFLYIERFRPSGITFYPAHADLRAPYWLISSEIEKSELQINPRYFFTNPITSKNNGSIYLVQEKYIEAYKRIKNID